MRLELAPISLVGLVAVLSSMTCACAKAGKHEAPPVAVRVETVARSAPASRERYSGTVQAKTRVDLAFRIGGYVESLALVKPDNDANRKKPRPLQAGDHVTQDMVLATLRQSDYRQKLSEVGALSQEASATQRKAKGDLARAQSLLASGSISQAEYDATKARVDALTGSAGAAAARVGQMKVTFGDTQLRSPLDGLVLERTVEVGGLVGPGTPAFVLADTSVVRVVFGVSDSVQGAFTIGNQVTVTSEATPDKTFIGVITKIAPQADTKTRSFEIEASIPNPDGLFKVGMVTTIQLGAAAGGDEMPIAVPLNAVVRRPTDGASFTVYVTTDQQAVTKVQARTVELGSLIGNRVAVMKGLQVGDRVVVQGATMVGDGARVAIVPAAPGSSS